MSPDYSAARRHNPGADQLSQDEHRLLTHITLWGSDGYPLRKLKGGRWMYQFGEISSPVLYKTKREATEAFERYESTLLDILAGRLSR